MIVEIEYYKGDTLLNGQKISFKDFKKQIKIVETLYNKKEDNFVILLCQMYHWSIVKGDMQAEYVYDRDIKKCINIH